MIKSTLDCRGMWMREITLNILKKLMLLGAAYKIAKALDVMMPDTMRLY
jgi:hypothetical protein